MSVNIDILKALSSQLAVLTTENCYMDPQLRSALGIAVGDQFLVTKASASTKYGLVTVYGEYEDGPDNNDIRLRLSARERFDETEGFAAVGSAWTAVHGQTLAQLESGNQFGEFLEESDDEQTSLLLLAPHGGVIEAGSAEIAMAIRNYLESASKPYSLWRCHGWQSAIGAYDAWHITSTDLSEASFPYLGQVGARAFDRALSIHGYGEGDVAVGGGGSSAFKEGIKSALEGITNFPYTVTIVTSGEYAGTDPSNIVNRYSEDGVQLELPYGARTSWCSEIANAIGAYLASL